METRILAEYITDAIIEDNPAIGKLLEKKEDYNNIADLVKDVLDHEAQLDNLL